MHYRALLLLLSLIPFPMPGKAIINVDQAIVDQGDDKASHTAHASIDGAQGNTNKNSIKADWLSRLPHGPHAEFFYAEYAYGKSSGHVDTNRLFAHLRHRTHIDERWAWEVFTQYGRDPFARLSLRVLAGGGLRWSMIERRESSAIYLGIGAFHEWERLSVQAGTSDRRESQPRLSSYLVAEHRFNAQVHANAIAYYQPALRDAADYRLLAQGTLNIRMNDHLDWQLQLDYSFDARPPQTVRPSDLRYSAGLAFHF